MKAQKRFNAGIVKFTFEDEDGDVFSSFRMNPTDINLAKRAEEVSEYFTNRGKEEKFETFEDAARYNKEIEDKICYLLGYDARDEVFGCVPATSISSDGEIFASVVLDFIVDKLKPEIEKRRTAMQNAINKHTGKYTG